MVVAIVIKGLRSLQKSVVCVVVNQDGVNEVGPILPNYRPPTTDALESLDV